VPCARQATTGGAWAKRDGLAWRFQDQDAFARLLQLEQDIIQGPLIALAQGVINQEAISGRHRLQGVAQGGIGGPEAAAFPMP
jgi:hypothetical protein